MDGSGRANVIVECIFRSTDALEDFDSIRAKLLFMFDHDGQRFAVALDQAA